jgi:hypothetical protein
VKDDRRETKIKKIFIYETTLKSASRRVCVLTCEKTIFPFRFEGIADSERLYFCHDLEAQGFICNTSLRGRKDCFHVLRSFLRENRIKFQSHVGVFIDESVRTFTENDQKAKLGGFQGIKTISTL